MANCKICGRPIILVPTAKERAEKYGGSPADYVSRFDIHPDCFIEQRFQETQAMMRRMRNLR